MNNIYRKMTLNDLEQIMQIEKDVFAKYWSENFFINMINDSICFVNILNNKLLGYFVGMRFDKFFYLMNFAISRFDQNKGYGSQMMRFLLSFLKQNNFFYVFLDVRESNSTAINLYKKFSFVPYQKKEKYYSSPAEDAIQMLLSLKWLKNYEKI